MPPCVPFWDGHRLAGPAFGQLGDKIICETRVKSGLSASYWRLCLLKLATDATVIVQGKSVPSDQLVADQEVTLDVVQDAKGDVQIAKVLVSPAKTKAE